MKRNSFIAVFAILLVSACENAGSLELRIVTIERGAIGLEVINETSEEIVVLSPEAPAQQADAERCVLLISTKVTDDVRPYAFTPKLESVGAGAVRRFRAALAPVSLTSKTCTEWTVDAEYAYVLPSDVAMFKGRAFEDFRQHVLKNQKVLTTSAKGPVKN